MIMKHNNFYLELSKLITLINYKLICNKLLYYAQFITVHNEFSGNI